MIRKTPFFSHKAPCLLLKIFKLHAFSNKRIKIQELGSDMLEATQNIGSKYAYDMFILCVQIFKIGAKSLF